MKEIKTTYKPEKNKEYLCINLYVEREENYLTIRLD